MAVMISFIFLVIVFLKPIASYKVRATCCDIELNPCSYPRLIILTITALKILRESMPQ